MEHYIGIDFHTQHSSVCVMDEKGNIMDECKLYHNDPQGFNEYFSAFPEGTNVSVEATRNWYWLIDTLQELNLNVKLVHAKKARIIAESTIKTDKIDARILAHLDRSNFLPQAYIADKTIRSSRELLRYYMSLVKIRTSIKNRVHAILSKNNIHQSFSDIFGKSGILFLKELKLPAVFRIELDGYLNIIDNIKIYINKAKDKIKASCEESKYAQLLMTIPGISYFSGLVLAAEIADIKRFNGPKKLCAYAGLSSSTRQSADKVYHGHIIKESNKYIRYTLIEAVPIAVKRDSKLFAFYSKIERKKGRAKAKVATARKLLTAIYYMLKFNRAYCINKNFTVRVNPVTKLGAKAAL